MLKMEIYRIMRRPIVWLIILVGLVLAVWPVIQQWPHGLTAEDYATYPGSAYIMWMYFVTDTYPIYALIFPLLASLAYSDAYAEDFNSGFIKNILTKVEKKRYLTTRYIVNFVVGGIIAVLPLVINFMGEMVSYPLIQNNFYLGMAPVQEGNFWPDLFYSHPLIYVVLRIIILFLLGGILSSFGLALSTLIRNRYIVLVFPFILFMGLDLLGFSLNLDSISGLFLYNFGAAPWKLPFYIIVGILGGFIWFYSVGKNNETV